MTEYIVCTEKPNLVMQTVVKLKARRTNHGENITEPKTEATLKNICNRNKPSETVDLF